MHLQSINRATRLADTRLSASARSLGQLRPRRLVVSNATQTAKRTTKKEAIKDARDDVRELIKSRHCNPILVRVAWHDSGTYDKVGRMQTRALPSYASMFSEQASRSAAKSRSHKCVSRVRSRMKHVGK